MIINLDSITIDKPIPGLHWTPGRCSTLADLLTALVTQAGSGQDVYAVSGVYDPKTEAIVITLSNNSTFAIPASLLLPVVADGGTITGNGTSANKLTGYRVDYDPATGALMITPPDGTAVTVAAQTALTEMAIDTEGLVGTADDQVTTQQLLDKLALKAGASLINATATNIAPNVPTNPKFSQVAYQEHAIATTGANSNITIQQAGRYLITAAIWWASENWNAECGMHGTIHVNGATVYAGGRLDHSRKLLLDPVNTGQSKFLSYTTALTCILPLRVGDVVTFTVVHDDNINHNLLTNSGNSWFQLEKL